MNQLRHLRFFGGKFENLVEHMKKHKALIAPKFQIVESTLEQELADLDIANWSNPQGGYFISFNQKGCAKRIVSLCKEAGVVLTGAGASFPTVWIRKMKISASPHIPHRGRTPESNGRFRLCCKAGCRRTGSGKVSTSLSI